MSAHTEDADLAARAELAAPSGPAATLTVSLRARHAASVQPAPILVDSKATELVGRLGLSLEGVGEAFGGVITGTAVRSELFDQATWAFAAAHSGATVVTVAAGLCTRFARLADLDVSWVDIDLPPVADLRRTLLPAGPDRTVIAADALEHAWRASLAAKIAGGPVLFILEGFTMYLSEPQVRELLADLADRFPGGEILIETSGALAARGGKRAPKSVMAKGTAFTWGVQSLDTVAAWHPRLCHTDTWCLMDYHRDRWHPLYRAMRLLPALRVQSKVSRLTIDADT